MLRILGIGARLKPVAAADDVPVGVAYAPAIHGARRTALRPVVLRAAADVVERLRVVDRNTVVLRHGQVGEKPERLTVVVGLVQPAVVSDEDVVHVNGIERDDVVIDVHTRIFPADGTPGSAAVGAPIQVGVDG